MDASGYSQALQDLTNQVDGVAAAARERALTGNNGAADSASLKRQLQSLKSSIINLGQKCAFAEALQHGVSQSLKTDADKAAAAVENAEDELKEWKSANKQDEQQLRQAVASVLAIHTQFTNVAARVQTKVNSLTRQQAEMQHASQAHDMAMATGPVDQAGSNAALSAEATQASELEVALVQARENAQLLASSLAAERSQIAALDDAIQQLQAVQQAARDDGAAMEQQAASLQRALQLVKAMTGVQDVELSASNAVVTLKRQGDGPEHKLHAQLAPGSLVVLSAYLQPTTIDVSHDLHDTTTLSSLIATVQARLVCDC